MTDAAFLSSALAGLERRLRLVEGDGLARMRAQAREIRATREAGTSRPFSRENLRVRPVCALKEAVHALCPVFLLDVKIIGAWSSRR